MKSAEKVLEWMKKYYEVNGTPNYGEIIAQLEMAIEEEKQLILSDVVEWVSVDDNLPPILETIWLSNGKGWTDLGCRVETNEGWHWAGQNGIIYQEKDQIVAECDSDDLDVVYWCKLPKPPCA